MKKQRTVRNCVEMIIFATQIGTTHSIETEPRNYYATNKSV